MTYRDEINIEYFTWLLSIVQKHSYPQEISYEKLLQHLHAIEFRPVMERDENRAEKGLSLRYHFACDRTDLHDVEYHLDGPCSVFEMLIALAKDIENVMDDTRYGDRTGQWFWGMLRSLGLYSMTDTRFDREFVNERILIFMNREYCFDGTGGLFTIRDTERDMRDVEIWVQACWYMNTIA